MSSPFDTLGKNEYLNNFGGDIIPNGVGRTLTGNDEVASIAATIYQVSLPIIIGLVACSMMFDVVRYGVKKEYTAHEKKGWIWKNLIFKLLLVVILVNFPYLFSIIWNILDRVLCAINGRNQLVRGDFDYLLGEKADIYVNLVSVISPVVADIYALIFRVGLGLLAIAGLIAGIGFGVCKDQQFVREYKQWLIRILIAALMSGSVLAVVGIAAKIII